MNDHITDSIIVKGGAADLYALWENVENAPYYMNYITSVQKTADRTSHWVMAGPQGATIEWDLEITRLDENKRIGWNSRDGGDVKTSGQVTFNALPNNETEVTVTMLFIPSEDIGDMFTGLFGSPEVILAQDLRNFKTFAESRLERMIG